MDKPTILEQKHNISDVYRICRRIHEDSGTPVTIDGEPLDTSTEEAFKAQLREIYVS